MSKNRFISSDLVEIDLGDGDIIKVRKEMSFERTSKIYTNYNEANPMTIALPMLVAAIVEWNLTGKDGVVVPCTEENIKLLDSKTVLAVSEKLTELYLPEKKSSMPSSPQSSEVTPKI